MEDDIDIEEHDVMDNPRIKSMFPDLSIVKIERLDDGEDMEVDVTEGNEEMEAGNEEYILSEQPENIDYRPQEMHYTYEYSFETTAENVEQPEFEEEYYHGNKIILGSKPPIDPQTLYEEALNSTTLVCLENWGERLNTSPCYCHDCQILFPTINALDAHKTTRHSYLVALDIQKNTARKSTVTSKYCNHCFKTFPDDTSLIKHLYELLPMNNFPKTPKKTEKVLFKCQKCKKVFDDYAASKRHKNTAHPNLSTNTTYLIVKVKKSKLKLQEKTEEKSSKSSFLANREGNASLIPKNTLFQCNTCHINFISCFGACKHAKVCKKETLFQKCGICERKIKDKDVSLHKLQHEYSEKIKIYTIHKNIYEKVLFKCPKCVACFDELLFWAHYKDCSNAGSSYCPDCDLNIATARYKGHRLKHKSKKYSKKDFIIVEFHDKDQPVLPKFKNLEGIKNKRVRGKYDPSGGVTLYYCEFCGCCQYILSRKGHTDGLCKTNISKQFCDRCGLCISARSKKHHELLHQSRPFTRKNCKIYSLSTGKEVNPPSPKMYQCFKCGKHFLTQRAANYHNCKTESGVSCKICAKKFNLEAYRIHWHYHLESDMIPELLKKYKSIKQIWNILYKCVLCELIIVNYDSVISHAQNHFNNLQDDVKFCSICDFKVLDNDFKDHENLHMNNQSISRTSFKILDFDYKKLLKDDWMVLFQHLPKQIEEQILSKSIYKYTRRIKMDLHCGPTDEARYLCLTCKRYVEGTCIEKHFNSCNPKNKYICIPCGEIFKSLQSFLKHEGTHENQKKGIVLFNDPADKSFNNNLFVKEKKKITKDKRYNIYKCAKCEGCVFLKHSMQRHSCGKKRFCVICNQYFTSKIFCHHLVLHERKPNVNKNTLNIIMFNEVKGKEKAKVVKSIDKDDLSFVKSKKDKSYVKVKVKDKNISNDVVATKSLIEEKETKDKSFSKEKDTKDKSLNKEKDTNDKSLTKEKDKLSKSLPLNKEEEGSYWVVPIKSYKQPFLKKIYRCECGLHFTSLNSIQDHLDICEENQEISKEKCSKCHLLFPTDILVSHLVKHHSKETQINKEKDIETIKKIQFYKCLECKLIFTSNVYFESHYSSCSKEIENGRKCNYCHFTFDKKCFDIHQCSGRGVDATYMNKITNLRNDFIFTTVYQCLDCDINYLNNSSFRYHVADVNHESKCQLTVCDVCGLRFTSYSSHKHFEIHSQTGKYKIKIIDPINGRHSTIEGVNTLADTKKRKVYRRPDTLIKRVRKDLDIPLKVYNTRRADKSKNLDDSKSDNDVSNNLNDSSKLDLKEESIKSDLNDSELKSDDYDSDSGKIEKLSKKLKARILVDKYTKDLYRCAHCDQHYMKLESLQYHITKFNHRVESELFKCDICGLDFSKNTLPRHKYVHHQRMKLKREDFCIITDTNIQETSKSTDTEKSTEKSQSFLKSTNTEKSHTLSKSTEKDTEKSHTLSKSIEKDTEKSHTLSKSIEKDTEKSHTLSKSIEKDTEKSHTPSKSTEKDNEITQLTPKVNKITYYKCSDCNVCFINKLLCYNHTKKHEILDPKMYIECKICDFQFLIDSLKDHMDCHHNVDFRIENLTIEEYKFLGDDLEPKIDTYNAVDKVQSRLVSTTTDVDDLKK